ncbi:MAG: hypothetical protein KGO96_06850 [Elusimicrobia bacterium]|nr:hypothetical protein [Elusimicrobiota bacterium]
MKNNADTGIDKNHLKNRWWFDKGWIYEWYEATYHSRLTCCVCADFADFSIKNVSQYGAGILIDRQIKESGWKKGLIRAWCPKHK